MICGDVLDDDREPRGLICCVRLSSIIISIIVIIITFIAVRRGRGHVTRLPTAVVLGVIVATAHPTQIIYLCRSLNGDAGSSRTVMTATRLCAVSLSPPERQTSARHKLIWRGPPTWLLVAEHPSFPRGTSCTAVRLSWSVVTSASFTYRAIIRRRLRPDIGVYIRRVRMGDVTSTLANGTVDNSACRPTFRCFERRWRSFVDRLFRMGLIVTRFRLVLFALRCRPSHGFSLSYVPEKAFLPWFSLR